MLDYWFAIICFSILLLICLIALAGSACWMVKEARPPRDYGDLAGATIVCLGSLILTIVCLRAIVGVVRHETFPAGDNSMPILIPIIH